MLFCNVLTLAWFQSQDRGTTISDSRIQASSDFSPLLRKEEDRQSLVFALEAPSAQVYTGGYADDLHLISRLVMQVLRGYVPTLLWAAALERQKVTSIWGGQAVCCRSGAYGGVEM